MNNVYYTFGSASSLDLDILVIVDSLPSLEESKKLCHKFNEILQPTSTKKINTNLATIDQDHLGSVFKGTVDEVNNSVLETYKLHNQVHELAITKKIQRDKEVKVLRATRSVVSVLSRSQHREIVKESLKHNLITRIKVLDSIDLSIPVECSKYPIADVYKTIAFQIGQTIALLEDVELFTKEDIAERYPLLKDFIFRVNNYDLSKLELMKKMFVTAIQNYIPQMKKLEEDKWSN